MAIKKVIKLRDGMSEIVPPGTEAEVRTEPRMNKRMEISREGNIKILRGDDSTIFCTQDQYIDLRFSVKNHDKRIYELRINVTSSMQQRN